MHCTWCGKEIIINPEVSEPRNSEPSDSLFGPLAPAHGDSIKCITCGSIGRCSDKCAKADSHTKVECRNSEPSDRLVSQHAPAHDDSIKCKTCGSIGWCSNKCAKADSHTKLECEQLRRGLLKAPIPRAVIVWRPELIPPPGPNTVFTLITAVLKERSSLLSGPYLDIDVVKTHINDQLLLRGGEPGHLALQRSTVPLYQVITLHSSLPGPDEICFTITIREDPIRATILRRCSRQTVGCVWSVLIQTTRIETVTVEIDRLFCPQDPYSQWTTHYCCLSKGEANNRVRELRDDWRRIPEGMVYERIDCGFVRACLVQGNIASVAFVSIQGFALPPGPAIVRDTDSDDTDSD